MRNSRGENRKNQQDFDVVVIGGGPAGTTAATLLADSGWSVCLLEKGRHPRFHIGESLLPMNLPIFERLGVLDEVRKIGIKKLAAEFNSTVTPLAQDTFYFSRAINPDHPCAFQVRRSEFDELLFTNCQIHGVTAIQNIEVVDVDLESSEHKIVRALSKDKQQSVFSCKFVIDASGRETFLANKLKSKQKNARHQMAAIFGHYRNVQRRKGVDKGNISIYWFGQGWIWMIPLRDGVMSIGAVCWPGYLKTRSISLEEFLSNTLRQLPEVAKRIEEAELIGKIQATGNYSYASSTMIGNGYLLVGDAYAFVDPVFSSGVFLAMQSAVDAAELIDKLLQGTSDSKKLIQAYQRKIKRGIAAISWFIYRFNTPALHYLLMSSDDSKQNKWQMKMKSSVISILSGDVYGNPKVTVPLLMFKTLYYLLSLKNYAETIRFMRFKAKP